MLPEPERTSEDRLLGGRVRLLQPRIGHRAGTDAVLLAGLSGARAGEHVIDLGSASGAVGLMIAAHVPTARVSLIEREPGLVALAGENIGLNDVGGRVAAFECDVFGIGEPSFAEACPDQAGDRRGPPAVPADLVVTNPPFFEETAGIRASPDAGRRKAHVMEGGGLRDWLAAAARVLKPRGRLALIHRADALGACLAALAPDFGAPAVMPIHPRAGRNASRILVFARRGGRSPLLLLPPLILHEPDGRFTPEAARLHDPALG
ncbi:tRNA1(Val) (adenine(37)-N6)-methyltransferase [Enterovirga rhinocerotis]|uniref:tRNA1(Val) A37 N6-methylase TrmN6 n=1 Tax=Enterovirga rhinocerotis TaxID=1339210 RepID=A0A4R7C6Z1_9HYPH|nr:methyltransferase [Enterovirga rhinocerotis]TDR94364.1 tRNA1(Val) A37 N6-methylase TrmN6 [Enterovirga rhinocerotis]